MSPAECAEVKRALVREGVKETAASKLAETWHATLRSEKLAALTPRERSALERIIGTDDLLGIEFLDIMSECSKAVGRIVIKGAQEQALGTGFLVGRGLLMTNHHVFSAPSDALECRVQFDYQRNRNGTGRAGVYFDLEPERFFVADEKLDYALVAVAKRSTKNDHGLEEFGVIPVQGDDALVRLQAVVLIQHPRGEYKKIALRENQVVEIVNADTRYIRYVADTHRGSSGAPVLNLKGELVALHHTGVPQTDAQGRWLTKKGQVFNEATMDDDDVNWINNEGVKVIAIVKALKEANGAISGTEKDALLSSLLSDRGSMTISSVSTKHSVSGDPGVGPRHRTVRPLPATETKTKSADDVSSASDGASTTVHVDVPIEIQVHIGHDAAPAVAPRPRRDEVEGAVERLRRNRDRIASAPKTYYDAGADKRALESYYAGIEPKARPEALYDALAALVESTHDNRASYNPSHELYPWVDLRADGKLMSIYSAQSLDAEAAIRSDAVTMRRMEEALTSLRAKGGSAEALAAEALALEAQFQMNCEHVVPQSWFRKQEPMRGDLHHLFTCEARCNGYRSNYPFGDEELTAAERQPPSDCGVLRGNRFYPQVGRGTVARAILYFLVRYPGEINRTGSRHEYNDRDIDVFLKWNEQYPPELYERHRNAAIEQRQGNRNPFIDHPEWARKVAVRKGLGA
ncbi:Endonuclease I [Minicystis rosea]|nr:Endonuclease I [Minicystis rosea]